METELEALPEENFNPRPFQRALTEFVMEMVELEALPEENFNPRPRQRALTECVRGWEARGELEEELQAEACIVGKTWFNKSEDGHPCPGLERFAAATNCRRALQEEQESSGLPAEISGVVRSFCFELTFRKKTVKLPFWRRPREELIRIGTEAGLFDGLAETLSYLHVTYAAQPERRAMMEKVREFYLKALSHMQARGTTRKAWAEGPSEIQWWEMLHQIRALVAHEASLPAELEGIDESTPLEEVEARILRKIDATPESPAAPPRSPLQKFWSNGSNSTVTSVGGMQEVASLAYWTELLQSCPAIRAGLNTGLVGPRILTASKWTYSKNVLFELLAQADELELWGPTDHCLLEQCATRAHDDSYDGLIQSDSSDESPRRRRWRRSRAHLSYYYADGPRVALSERVLLAEQERARVGFLQTVVHSRAYGMQLSLWTPRKMQSRDAHAQLLRCLKTRACKGAKEAAKTPPRTPAGSAKIDSQCPPRCEEAWLKAEFRTL